MASDIVDVRIAHASAVAEESRDERFERARSRLEDVYSIHSSAVHGVARHLCGTELADQMTINVFVQLWENPDIGPCEATKVRMTLLALCVDEFRAIVASGSTDPAEHLQRYVIDHSRRLEQCAVRKSRKSASFFSIGESECLAVALACYGKCSCTEIATILEIKEATVNTLLRHGLKIARASN